MEEIQSKVFEKNEFEKCEKALSDKFGSPKFRLFKGNQKILLKFSNQKPDLPFALNRLSIAELMEEIE